MQARYVSLPEPSPRRECRKKLLIVQGVAVPLVPAICCLLFVVGLPCWISGMLQARAHTDDICTGLGITPDGLAKLKAYVLAAVIVVSPLMVLMLAVNLWLEASRTGSPSSLSSYSSNSHKINIANWLLLLLSALVLAGSITWLAAMSATLSATQGAGGGKGPSPPWWPPAAATAPAPPPVPQPADKMPKPAALASATMTTTAAAGPMAFAVDQLPCPAGCVDLGGIAAVLGLPWHCYCGPIGFLDDLAVQLSQVVQLLSLAVSGALMLFIATSWLYGYLAAQSAHAERDLMDSN